MSQQIRKRGKKWYYRFKYIDENGNAKISERVGGSTKAEAEKARSEALKSYQINNVSPVNDKKRLGDAISEFFLDTITNSKLKPGTMEQYERAIQILIPSLFYWKPIHQITLIEVQEYFDELVNSGDHTLTRIRMAKNALSSVYKNIIVLKGYFSMNIASSISIRQPEENIVFGGGTKTKKVISKDEFDAIITALSETLTSHYWAIIPIFISYYTGLRIGEVLSLAWDDVDMENKTITVRRSLKRYNNGNIYYLGVTKYNRIRQIPFGENVYNTLLKAKEIQNQEKDRLNDNYNLNISRKVYVDNKVLFSIFSTKESDYDKMADDVKLNLVCTRENGQFILLRTMQVVCNRVAKFLKMPKLSMHVLRHSYATNLINLGAQPTDVRDLMGHRLLATTMDLYVHSDDISKMNAVKRLDFISN